MPDLDRDAILSVTDSEVRPLNVPEWGGTVHIRTLTGDERDAVEHALERNPKTGQRNQANFRAFLTCLVVCNASGKRLFTNKDIPLVGKKNGAAIERIVDAALDQSKLRGESDVEEALGNSSDPHIADSGTVSPDTSDAPSESADDE